MNPLLMFFPYLPLDRPYSIGAWNIIPLSQYQGPWLSGDFENRSRTFLQAFKDAYGRPLGDIPLLVHGARGTDGRLPNRRFRTAMQTAVHFACLDRNPVAGTDNAGHVAASTDNSELFIWPIDVRDGYVALTRGAMIRNLDGGYRVDDVTVRSPLELQIPITNVVLDQDILTAVYKLCTNRYVGDQDAKRRRIEVAITWLSQAWRNTESIRATERVVYLKTGFEALTDSSDSWTSALYLRDLYETALAGVDRRGAEHLLWSPGEKERFQLRARGQNHSVTDLQDWFMTFAYARNTIIHDGTVPKMRYRKARSAYNGPLVYTAERLLRESIRVSMGELGFPDVWRTRLQRTVHTALQGLA